MKLAAGRVFLERRDVLFCRRGAFEGDFSGDLAGLHGVQARGQGHEEDRGCEFVHSKHC
ncbi:hypothetical protein SDC9_185569 [bioreactor metagenome]|uniref:Uncharacterized protein n=1 Tax=bioreactor metagenome TaxID=1076179 RepID=A0A645HHI5_9ZZZZ